MGTRRARAISGFGVLLPIAGGDGGSCSRQTVPIELIDTLVKGPAYYRSDGPEYTFRLIGQVVLCAAGAWVKDRRIQIALAALYFVDLVSLILCSYRMVE